MANFDSLPLETQSLIFQHVDSTKQLGLCRLANKHWDELAECAMFMRRLCITERSSASLYAHLSRKPLGAHLIKKTQFLLRTLTDTTAQLLRLAITPSLERILPCDPCVGIRLHQILTEMIQDTDMKLQHLKSISWPTFGFTQTHYQLALLLRDSLEEFIVSANANDGPHEIAQHLKESKRLSKLRVGCRLDIFYQAKQLIFRGARQLKVIGFDDCNHDKEDTRPAEERLIWMKQNVEINDNAITLHTSGDVLESKPLLEYFLYKYPNTKQLNYHSEWRQEGEDIIPEISTQTRLSISRIPNYSITLNRQHKWRSHYEYFAGY